MYLYVQAILDQAQKEQESSNDERLMPHIAAERAEKNRRAIEEGQAYYKLTGEQMLDLAYHLYG